MQASQVPAALVTKVVLVACGVLGAIFLVWQIRDVVGLFLIAILFALAVAPAVDWLSARRVPRWLSILLVYLSIGAAIFGIGLLIVPPVIDGVEELSSDLPGYVDDLRDNETFRDFDDEYDITGSLEQQATELPNRLGDAAGTLRDVTVGVFSSFIQMFSILVIAFFLLIEGRRILEFGYERFPPHRAQRLRKVADDISDAVSGYVFGNFVISILAGSVTYITLTLMDVPFAIPLAIVFAFFDLIPLVGATIGGVLVGIVVVLAVSPLALLIWLAVLLLYQQLENNLIQPYVYGQAVQIHPLVVIVAILIGASLLGILGALIAIPTAAAVQAVIRDWWTFRGERLAAEAKESAGGIARPEPGELSSP